MRLLIALLMILLAGLHLLWPIEPLLLDDAVANILVVELRLPRTLIVLGYGAALGISGAALQAIFANPLASPDITGASKRYKGFAEQCMAEYDLDGWTAPDMAMACLSAVKYWISA